MSLVANDSSTSLFKCKRTMGGRTISIVVYLDYMNCDGRYSGVHVLTSSYLVIYKQADAKISEPLLSCLSTPSGVCQCQIRITFAKVLAIRL